MRRPVMEHWIKILFVATLSFNSSFVSGDTDPGDVAILQEFQKGLDNANLLNWPKSGGDPCGRPLWPHVFCSGSRVSQIQVQGLGLSGPLPQNFNQLSMLTNLGLQRNNFTGKLPSFSGLSKLQYAYLGGNQFDTIPPDFFTSLTSLQVLSLDRNPLNQSTGWSLPQEFQNSAQLTNLSLISCNLIGPLPDFLGGMPSLTVLKLSHNSLSGEIPASFSGLSLRTLWLNDQAGAGLSGSIDVIASMLLLTNAWLNGNSFTGLIPTAIGACTSLTNLSLNDNQIFGIIPKNLTALPQLQSLHLDNNKLMGPIPEVGFRDFTYSDNSFCQSTPGVPCSREVTALLDFLGAVNYPPILMASWLDNDPCTGKWRGVSCIDNEVSIINLSNLGLNGSISLSVGTLDSLVDIRLGGNNLNGTIPENLTNLKLLKMLNVSGNTLGPPVPKFSSGVTLLTYGNPLLESSGSLVISPPGSSSPSGNLPSPSGNKPPSGKLPHGGNNTGNQSRHSTSRKLHITVVPIVLVVLTVSLVILFVIVCCRCKGNRGAFAAPNPVVVHPRDPSDPDNVAKIAVANNADNSLRGSNLDSGNINGTSKAHVTETGNSIISVHILRSATQNFASKNEVGRGGFGVVYKGDLHDGTVIAVKRMEAAVMSNKASDEFEAEIAVLSKLRHRNLVCLLGYSVEGSERLLVYEYMPQGALSKHLFHWRKLNLEPLTWKKRLNIALDIARGMEYLHNFAHQCFIHRDLKSSNILLSDDYRAKVSDFGLVKLAPDGKNSVVTRVAGTFGYLAPEYAVTGKITTKADVYSFGVVLMELVTGLKALDENRPEESRYLASWFNGMRSDKKLMDTVDPSLDATEEIFGSISIIAELAGHCAAREPHQRPDVGHAVNVLAPLVEKWKPINDDQEEYLGIDLGQPLLQMVKGWQAADSTNVSSAGLDDSKGSIPARPAGFADSFTSADGR